MRSAKIETQSPRRWFRWGLLAFTSAVGLWLLIMARGAFLPFFLSFVLAYLLAPLIELASWHGRIHRGVAILGIYALFVVIMSAGVIYIVPVLVRESVRFIQYVPHLALVLQQGWNYWLARFHQQPMPNAIRSAVIGTGLHVKSQLLHALKSLVGAIFRLVPGVLSFVVAPILAFYVLKDLPRMRDRFWEFVPVDWRASVYKLGFDLDRALNGYIRGQIMVALMVGILSSVWMMALHIPFALLIGAVAAITDIIPYVGPIAGAIPAVILGLLRSPWISLYAVIGFIVIHQLEGTVISPKVIGNSVGLHPLVIIFAILAGGEIAGFLGLLLAVPTAAVAKVVVTHLYRRLAVSLDHDSTPSVQ
ncbi:MAG: AI-2E family transporter [Sulfobacillus acidophilus]|uniref:AI-2E family transporter n=1 Tax=Sulfobacillus acidophilus TaxID=53633 RepID=A0A2T2WPG6_9FIRM|nr:MAG: AI-2E family transporter [Sulfobacillus acidophilus]